MAVLRCSKAGRARAKDFGLCIELDMHLKTDNGFKHEKNLIKSDIKLKILYRFGYLREFVCSDKVETIYGGEALLRIPRRLEVVSDTCGNNICFDIGVTLVME